MSGVVVMICVPTELKENEFLSKQRVRIVSNKKAYEIVHANSSGNEEIQNLSSSLRQPMIKVSVLLIFLNFNLFQSILRK